MPKSGQIGNTIDRTPIGFKIYYSDDRVFVSEGYNLEELMNEFLGAPSDDVLVVDVFLKGQYKTWRKDKWDTDNYKERFCSEDYYWIDETNKTFHKGNVNQIPDGLPDGGLKVGILVSNEEWVKNYTISYNDKEWS